MRVELSVVQGRGAPRTITLDAPSVEAAREQAIGLGLAVLSARALTFQMNAWLAQRSSSRDLDIVVFVEQLRDLLVAGLSVVEALDALRRGARGGAGTAIERLQRQLQEGKTLSDALSGDAVFSGLLVALVRASELTSDLPQSLTRFLEHEQRVAEVRHRITSTLIYPTLLIGVGCLVLLFLLFYVMPRFARIFEGMHGDLPWSAQMMVAWAHTLHAHSMVWIAGIGVALALVIGTVVTPSARAVLLRQALGWGPLRERLNIYFLSRWYRATGMLVLGGIPLSKSLQLANCLLPLALQPGGAAVERGVREGLAPSTAHARAGMTTPMAEQLLLAGERTGDLGTVLTRIAHFHEAEVSRDLERTLRALEPIVMVAIGLGVGIVVVMMYMPIFELASAIQ